MTDATASTLAEALRDRYTLEHELGRGGMARVYLARDIRHRRRVAVKVLHPEIAQSLGSERFLREIETAAGLQHPHIVPLFDSGEAGGLLYYVMPYVEGESLRSRLAREKSLPIDQALEITHQVCSALAYAHAQGIIHRDVKPENILLKHDQAVVADFGIARAVSASGGESFTGTGMAIGTPAYMSPEQASAERDLDGRSDVYSMACVLYEMLAGHAPFFGMSARELMARHATDPVPPLRTVRLTVPLALERVVMKALAKVPADRFSSAETFRQALTQVGQGLASGDQQVEMPTADGRPIGWAAKLPARRWILALGVGALAIAGAISALYWYGRPATNPSSLVRHRQLTFVGNVDRQEISPDGKLVAYVEGGEIRRLMIKDLVGGSTIPIARLGPWTVDLRWSPDGARIMHSGADSTGQPSRVSFPRLGGSSQQLPTPSGFGVFSPEGSRIATWSKNPGPLLVTTLASGQERKIAVPKILGWLDAGDWSPDARRIALLGATQAEDHNMLWIVDVDDGEWHEVLSDTSRLSRPRWSPTGDALYYLRGNDELRRIRVGRNGSARGTPEVLYDRLGTTEFSISADGSMLVYPKRLNYSNLRLATSQRGSKRFAERQLTRGTTMKTRGRLSPDGRRIAFVQGEGERADVFVLPIEGGEPQRVTSSGVALGAPPVWSPDGNRLAFVVVIEGEGLKLRTIALDGRDEHTYHRTDPSLNLAWAPHTRILYQQSGNRNFHWLDPVSEAEQPLVTNDSVGWMFAPVFSPDLQFVAVLWNRRPAQRIYRISLRDATQVPLGPANASPMAWSADGTSLYAGVEDKIWRLPVNGGVGSIAASNPFKNDADCGLTDQPTGLLLLCAVDESVSDAWTIENFDPSLSKTH